MKTIASTIVFMAASFALLSQASQHGGFFTIIGYNYILRPPGLYVERDMAGQLYFTAVRINPLNLNDEYKSNNSVVFRQDEVPQTRNNPYAKYLEENNYRETTALEQWSISLPFQVAAKIKHPNVNLRQQFGAYRLGKGIGSSLLGN
jgi:hypothetical protein